MNIGKNDSYKHSQNKNNYIIRYSDSCNDIKRIKQKRNEKINDVEDINPNLYLKIPGKKYSKRVAKSKYYLDNALKRKKVAFENKEKEAKGESEFHKIKTFNPKNQINSQEEYFSPQYKKRSNFGIKKNLNDNGISKLVILTNKIYEDEEHFQKNIINKKNYKNISPNPKAKMKNILSERYNDLLPQNKKLSFGLNYKICNDLLPENSNKNIHFRRRLSSSIKPGDFNLFNRSKEKSNYSKLLKIKQNLRNISKEKENSKFFFETQKNNNKYKLNNDNQNVLTRAKTVRQRNKDNKYYEKIEEKRDKTTVKLNKKIKLNKMNTQKINANKINLNKNNLQDVDFNKKIIKNQINFKKYRKTWCFLCCINDDPEDSGNEN